MSSVRSIARQIDQAESLADLQAIAEPLTIVFVALLALLLVLTAATARGLK